MIRLSKNFTLQEALASQIADRNGFDNTPKDWQVIANICHSAKGMEMVRSRLGDKSIAPSSWYRCLEVNRKLESKDTSKHIKGLAVDFACPSFGSPTDIVAAIRDSDIPFNKVIVEFKRWVHISFPPIGSEAKRQAAVIKIVNGEERYIPMA